MTLIALFLCGILGAAQANVMWGLWAGVFATSDFADKVGWILVFAPGGAFAGSLIGARIVGFKLATKRNRRKFGAVWCATTLVSFPVSLMAPMLLVGLGPDNQKYRLLAFFVEYGIAWSALYLLLRGATGRADSGMRGK